MLYFFYRLERCCAAISPERYHKGAGQGETGNSQGVLGRHSFTIGSFSNSGKNFTLFN